MDFENSQYYTNRELSWIQFNYRVLEEARDKSNPLFERLKFLSITSSNLDEFFMVRVASLKDMVNAGYKKPDIAGMTPKEQLSAISEALHEFTQTQYSTYNRSLLPLLAKEHITVLTSFEQMNDEEASFADNFFMEKVYPVLTPMAVDASRPFPLIRNKSLNIAALIKTKNQSEEEMEPELEFATVQVPSVMGRIVQLPCTEGVKLILLEEIIRRNISKLFLNYDVISTAAYRIERNADLSIDEEEAEDLLQEIEKQLKQRQWGEAIKLEVSEEIDKYLLKYLKKELAISDEEIYKIQGPLDLTFLMKLYGMDVALVEYCTQDAQGVITAHVIEGNMPDRVQRNTHQLTDWRVMGYGTVRDLADIVMQSGNTGKKVQELQDMLCYLGYLDAQYATGTYGPSTVEAVRAFQQATDKVPTGIANHHTQLTLQHIYEETYWQDDANFIVRDE